MKKKWLQCVWLIATCVLAFSIVSAAQAEEHEFVVTDLNSFKQVVETIKLGRDTNALTEATIIFKQDIDFTDTNTETELTAVGRNYFSGIEGVTLTLTSEGTEPVTLKNLGATFGSTRLTNAGFNTNDQNARFFTGPMILDNIKLQTSDRDYFFAQGYPLVITENFKSTSRISIVGGCLGTNKRMDGTGFPDSDGVGTGHGYEEMDKTENYPTSTHLEIYGGDYVNIIGGGYNSDVTGSFNKTTLSYDGGTYVKIQLDGDVENTGWYEVSNVYGGSYVRRNGTSTPSDGTSGKISGDTYVEVVSGVAATIYGGSNNLVTTAKSNGAIIGDTTVIVGTDTADGSEAVCQNVYGGSYYSTIGNKNVYYDPDDYWANAKVGGDIDVIINPSTRGRDNSGDPNGNIHGGGDCDIINGTVQLTLNGGSGFDWVFAGGANSDYEQITEINNMNKEKNAASIVINGGTWDEIYSGVHTWVGSHDADSEQKIDGNAFVQLNDGKVNYFCLSGPMTKIYGNSTLEINGGELGNRTTAISGYRYTSWSGNTLQYGQVEGKRILDLKNNSQMKCWQIYAIDKINVNNTEAFIARGTTANGALQSCGDVNIQGGTLALTGTNNISGDFTIANTGTLALNGTDATITTPGSVNAAGNASGAGHLLAVAPSASSTSGWITTYMTPQLPNVGEVYLRSSTTGETVPSGSDATLLDLANTPAQGRYVEYTTENAAITSSYSHAWRIAQDPDYQTYGVLYGFEAGTKGHVLTDEITALLPQDNHQYEMGKTVTAIQPEKTVIDDPDENGVYVFEGYKEGNAQTVSSDTLKPGVNPSDTKLYIHFTGVWKWYEKHSVTYEYGGEIPQNPPELPERQTTWQSQVVTVAQAPSFDGYTFNGWQVKSPNGLTLDDDGTFTMPNEDVVLIGSWTKNAPVETISIQPANVTIYMGGDGYEGTVNEDGQLITDSEQIKKNGFPEPGFLLTLPESLKNLETGNLYLQYKDENNTYQWKFEKYGDGDHNVYRIVPDGNTEKRPVRMQFVKNAGTENEEIVDSDSFEVEKYINETLTMKVYGEGIEEHKVNFAYDSNNNGIDNGDKTYDIAIQDGTLTVRGTTSAVQTVPVNKEESFTATKDKPGITAPANTTYTINGSDVKVKDTTGISLLFDNIIDSNAGNENAIYTDLLKEKVDETLGSADENRQYEYKYLDLVDTHNGNAWVAADKAVTVYWPLPEGADADADFTLLHFQDLHRSMSPTEITNKLTDDDYTPEKIEGTVESNHIVFDVQPYNNGSGGFSPYVLVWEDESGNGGDSGENTPSTPVTPPDGDDTPDLNTIDHFSYVVGYEDGMVKPEKAITRAEVATIFYRLLKDDVRAEHWTKSNDFTDVDANDWYNTTVSTLNAMGIITGYEDGSFKPNAPITRAEFAAMAVRFFEEDSAIYEEGTFNDIAGSEWFADAVQAAKDHGIIGGYPDGSFQPNKNISRAEACSIINRTLDRIPDADHLLPVDDMKNWPDNNPGDWYYADMQEATNGHEYEWITDDGKTVENWTGDREEIDWAKVEEELEAMYGEK